MRLFHRQVEVALKKFAFLSFRYITDKTAMRLIDPLISFLFYRTPNFFCNTPGYYRELLLYFTYESLIEVFDELAIEFNSFFRDFGVGREHNYYVMRLNNFDVVCFELAEGCSFEKIYA